MVNFNEFGDLSGPQPSTRVEDEPEEEIEDALDVELARHAETMAKLRGEIPIPWTVVRAGLDDFDPIDAEPRV